MKKQNKETLENVRDDSKDLITIDYYDRINHKWIKVETTKEVARLLHCEDEKTRRKQNKYNLNNQSFDELFDEKRSDFGKNEHYLRDEDTEIKFDEIDEELMQMKKDEHQRVIIENSLCYLTPEQREVVEMAFYKNMSYREIAEALNISKAAVYSRMMNAQKNIKNYIKNTEN